MRRILLLTAPALLAGCGTDVSGPAASVYSCVFTEPTSLAVGEAVGFHGTESRGLCLDGADGPADYLFVPFFAMATAGSDEPSLRLAVEVMGAGIRAQGPTADRLPEAAPLLLPDPSGEVREQDGLIRLDHEFHRRLRQREVEELGPMIRPAAVAAPGGVPGAALRVQPALPAPGDLLEFNVALNCTAADIRTGRVEQVSEHAILVADVENPAGGFTGQDYAAIVHSFDTLVHPVSVRHFGEPSDIDGNGRTIIFLTRAVNELTPRSSSTFTAGLFWGGDLFPEVGTERLEACPAGNQAEMFYVAVPDPNGVVSRPVSAAWIRDRVALVLGHEYQHLINGARRLYVNQAPRFERTWLNEGLSHVAEELLFFEAAGLPRQANLTVAEIQGAGAVTAFNRYMSSNVTNLAYFLDRPDTASLMGPDNLPTRGATWSFLRYAADRADGGDEAFLFALVNSSAAGLDNLDQVLGTSALDWIQDWTVALYADDHVPGIEARHTHPSWNLRDIFGTIDQVYPLDTAPLNGSGVRTLTLHPGGAGYVTFGVDADERATLHLESDGASPPRTLRGSFLRVR